MNDWYLRPEEIIAEIRKRYPTEKALKPPKRPSLPRLAFANEYLYGAPIYVYGEGIKGQYLRHAYFDREGKRYWVIEYGFVTLYGKLRDGKIVPLVVLGVPTRFVFEYKPKDFVGYPLEVIPMGSIECLEAQMINLDRVMQGKDPILIIDKYDFLRGDGGKVPTEFMDRIMEQQRLIETLQTTVWEYEKAIKDYQTNINILQARVAKLQELVTSYESKIIRLSTEVTSVQQELIRLREEILVRGTEAETLEETRKRLRDLTDELTGMVKDVSSWISDLRRTIQANKPREEGEKT